MTRRYFVPDLRTQGPLVKLPSDEALHAGKVMRCQVGDAIELFDGQGFQATATIRVLSRKECVVDCQSPEPIDREPDRRLLIAVALPKPDRAKEMIERLCELGVHTVQPIIFQHTQRAPSDSLIDKLSRIVIESCKQCGRNQLMPIQPVQRLEDWLNTPTDNQSETIRLLAKPGGQSWHELNKRWPATDTPHPASDWNDQTGFSALVGPEGGFAPSELQAAEQAGFAGVDLGRRILRIETAACVIASRLLLS